MKSTRFFAPLMALALLAIAGCQSVPTSGPIEGDELAQRIADGNAPVVLDVRTPQEYATGHIPGAINIPHTEIEARLAELKKFRKTELVVHCRAGGRAAQAERVLAAAGFDSIRDLSGHMQQWRSDGHPVTND